MHVKGSMSLRGRLPRASFQDLRHERDQAGTPYQDDIINVGHGHPGLLQGFFAILAGPFHPLHNQPCELPSGDLRLHGNGVAVGVVVEVLDIHIRLNFAGQDDLGFFGFLLEFAQGGLVILAPRVQPDAGLCKDVVEQQAVEVIAGHVVVIGCSCHIELLSPNSDD
jgi:hypothetical protein